MAARTPRKLRLWEALALSVGLMGPTLAMGLNGPGVAATAGKAVPLVFLLGLAGVGLVGYGFWRLTQHFNHAGSVYALAGATIGPRAGFFGGFALLGTYLFFLVCTQAATAVFANAFLNELGIHHTGAWIAYALLAAVGCAVLNVRDTRFTARTLLLIEGIGIIAMLVLAAVVVGGAGLGIGHHTASGGAPSIDLSTFTPGGTTMSAVMTATVFAFLSWAGFEACASLGEETDNPRRNIPRALVGSVILTGILYVLLMFTQTIGFGTDTKGIAAFAGAESPMSTLSQRYVGTWFSLIVAFTAVASAFASSLSSSAAASRMVFALARDGFGPKAMAKVDPDTGAPRTALFSVVAVTTVADVALWAGGAGAFDSYYWFATLGVLCVLVAYAVAAAGVIKFTFSGRGNIPRWETIIPTAGIAYLAFVFYKQSTGQTAPYTYFPWIAGAWCVIGVLVILCAPRLAAQIGARLTGELAGSDSDVEASSQGSAEADAAAKVQGS
ncbi:MAG TPA: APC family permease [Flexivirga sp.]|uniref:APC family permease n=1 Tax=Flexivirga sp. TaxID=1962927 RepID=UPI002CFB9415|nr:APC family permease [Flexivirga sp.]HWC22820.1 APC family permease [Flexivirga sp.]